MGFIRESINEIKKHPKQALKDAGMVWFAFMVFGALLFMSAVLQGCSITKSTTIRGKATIITVDTTVVRHNGTIKFTKGK